MDANERLRRFCAVVNYLAVASFGDVECADLHAALTATGHRVSLRHLRPTVLPVRDNGDYATTLVQYCIARARECRAVQWQSGKVTPLAEWADIAFVLISAGLGSAPAARYVARLANAGVDTATSERRRKQIAAELDNYRNRERLIALAIEWLAVADEEDDDLRRRRRTDLHRRAEAIRAMCDVMPAGEDDAVDRALAHPPGPDWTALGLDQLGRRAKALERQSKRLRRVRAQLKRRLVKAESLETYVSNIKKSRFGKTRDF